MVIILWVRQLWNENVNANTNNTKEQKQVSFSKNIQFIFIPQH